MKVKILKELIKDLPDEMSVIIAKDTEGNWFSPVSDVDSGNIYVPETASHGEVYSAEWSAEDALMEQDEWEKLKKEGHRCVVLWPVN